MTTKLEENTNLKSFKEFVKTQAAKRNLSMRKLSQAIGMAPSYFSEILNGKKKINPSLLNSLADYFQMPRVDVYQAAGWLEYEGNDFIFHQQMDEWYRKDPYYREAVSRLIAMDENQRNEVFMWLFQKTTQKIYGLEESEIEQELGDKIEAGSLQPKLFDQLSPKQRQTLADTTQLFIEAFLAKNANEEGDKDKDVDDAQNPKKAARTGSRPHKK